ncbi:hypothetical protein NQ317_001178 [Molorchus minor]|uniref:FAD synthase n=1 Tax=Molorchus minor TaxID=1323400 RepID=A0ABQ9J1J6_9CUCU|nr:hypothetical protein NQ317_001178 [Molorchus minor]
MLKTVGVIFVSDNCGKKDIKSLNNLLIELNLLDYEIDKVSIIPQYATLLRFELDMLIKQCDLVLVVAELNDIVFKAIAKVTFQSLKPNTEFQKIVIRLKDTDTYNLPVTTKILLGGNDDVTYPILHIQRIFVLKAQNLNEVVPHLRMHLKQYRSEPICSKVIHVLMNYDTTQLLPELKMSMVNMTYEENGELFVITLESRSFDSIVVDEENIREKLKNNIVQSFVKDHIFDMVYIDRACNIRQALETIEKCITQYGLENIFLSFNGGKDCTVLLHLVRTVLTIKFPDKLKDSILCLYARNWPTFPEQDTFIHQCQVYFNLEIMSLQLGIKDALKDVLRKKPNLKACFMGTRRTDPFSSGLDIFQMTDPDWPQIMRVNPVLDWHYSDIWDYLLYYKVPYCELYDMGFTSLGNILNTTRNPNLIYHDLRHGSDVYLPAYKMLDEDKERSGRDIQNGEK